MFSNLKIILVFLLISALMQLGCGSSSVTADAKGSEGQLVKTVEEEGPVEVTPLKVGAERLSEYLSLLHNRKVGLVVNQTSMVGAEHLVDVLLQKGIDIQRIFAPEHGFRGKADAGEQIKDGRDAKTGIPLISLYGKKKKPSSEDLSGIDVLIFDIQDVGARFYTYISSMHYVMEACAEEQVNFLVLDRPNPNGHYVDGPLLDPDYQSFIGMHPIPVVHGMTIAEYAQMINGEGWLKNGVKCELSFVKCSNYDHQTAYELPIKPSPNLPNLRSIYLYPWLCFFEGTTASVGRGTNQQFQIYGHPDYPAGSYRFTPVSREGAKNPKHQNKECFGHSLAEMPPPQLFQKAQIDLGYLLRFYQAFPNKDQFFLSNNFIDKLAGSDQLRQQIIGGRSEAEIRSSWAADLANFKAKRRKYLLYEDFE